jgi:hypothetical protein
LVPPAHVLANVLWPLPRYRTDEEALFDDEEFFQTNPRRRYRFQPRRYGEFGYVAPGYHFTMATAPRLRIVRVPLWASPERFWGPEDDDRQGLRVFSAAKAELAKLLPEDAR